MKNSPLVSICCLAYNQESFIKKTIEGFLLQKTNFPYEIIIHDDASKDRTKEIIAGFAREFPDIIIPIFQKENQYSKGNTALLDCFVFPIVRGKYIATCEGDDYWIDPYKLQKQVDFLEKNPDYGLVYTNSKLLFQETGVLKNKGIMSKEYKSFEDLLIASYSNITNLTVLIRTCNVNDYVKDIQPIHKHWLLGDYPTWLFTARISKLKLLKDITGVYRWQKESASHSSSSQKVLDFHLSVYSIKMFFVEKYNVNDNVVLKLKNNHFKNIINYAVINNDHVCIKECIEFLKEKKMYDKLMLVNILFFLKRFNLYYDFFSNLFIHLWKEEIINVN